MLVLAKRFEAVVYRGDRMAGAFDDHVNRGVAHERAPVVADVGRARLERFIERGRLRALGRPAHARQVAPCHFGRQIGNADQMNSRNARHLREVHRTELAGTDEADAHGLAVGAALLQLGV